MENNELREESTLAYGKNAVTELLKSGSGVDTVFVQDSMNEAMAGYYTALAKEAGAVVKRVHTQKLNNICGNDNHQGVAAYASSIEYLSLEELMAKSKERAEAPF
ncbi:MAG: RNA methyltransferase substrate-binding domain-containing protein, partial [Oscillospiraceae bacterium]